MAIEFLLNVLGSSETALRLVRFFIVLALGSIATRGVLMPLARRAFSKKENTNKTQSLVNVTGLTGLFITFTVALQAGSFGNLATIIGAIAAALTVAVGFGMRDQVANLTAGIMLYFDTPFVEKDYIRVGDYKGRVKEVKLRHTVLTDDKGQKLDIPNAMITTRPLHNSTRGSKTHDTISVESEPEKMVKAGAILKEVAGRTEDVLQKPAPSITYTEDYRTEVSYWVKKNADLDRIRTEIRVSYSQKAVEDGVISEEKE